MLRKLILRLRALLRNDIDEELQSHLEQLAEQFSRDGMKPDEALHAARRQFGNFTRTKEQSYEIFSFRWLDDLLRDLRYASRSIRRNPSVVIAAVLSMGLAIGVNTAVFSLLQDIFLSQPTVHAPEDLVNIRLGYSSHGSVPIIRQLNAAGVFESVAGFDIEKAVNWRDGLVVKQTPIMLVSENYFDLLGIQPALGRVFTAAEARAERNPHLVVITHRLWRRAFSEDSAIVGRAMILNGRPYTIIAVLPERFRPPTILNTMPDVYVPASPELNPSILKPQSGTLMLFARRKPGQSIEEARVALQVVAARMARENPSENANLEKVVRVQSMSGFQQYADPDAAPLVAFSAVLLVAVSLVLWIACVNVGGILLARAAVRRREIATRLAIGAGRARLVRQLLAEAFLLSSLGTVAGLALHRGLTSFLNELSMPLPVPVVFQITADSTLLLYAIVLNAICALVAGLAPALQATRHELTSGLKMEEPQYGHRWFTLRNGLIVAQVAATVVLLSIAMLFTRSLIRTHSINPGFDLQHTVLARISVVNDRYSKEQLLRFATQTLNVAHQLPGVQSAALAQVVPFNNFMRNGTMIQTATESMHAEYCGNSVTSGYFETIGISLLAGRSFLPRDRDSSPHEVIINQSFARKLFGGRPAVGERIWLGDKREGPGVEIVAVAADSKHLTMGEKQAFALYEDITQTRSLKPEINLIVRAAADAETIVPVVRDALSKLDDSAAVDVGPLRTRLAFAYLPSRIGAVLVGSLGGLALLLALIGIYGTMAFAVSRRAAEMGIRMALGASTVQVLRAVFGASFGALSTGIAIGIVSALAVARLLTAFLAEGVTPADPLTFACVILTCVLVGAVAALMPGRKVLSIDPISTLRVQ